MEILYSPWRSKYIESFKDEKSKEGCFVCEAIERPDEAKERLVVYRNNFSIVIMNKYPYNAGHLLVCPLQHVSNFDYLSNEELLNLMLTLKDSIRVLDKVLKPHGYNVGMNIGRTAGAGLPEHIHFHIIPRWNGDTSFITTVSDTKVISQSFEELYEKINALFNEKQ